MVLVLIKSSVVDTDPQGSELIWLSWIRIDLALLDPDPYGECRSGPRAKKFTKLTNKAELQPFKKKFVPMLVCFMTYWATKVPTESIFIFLKV